MRILALDLASLLGYACGSPAEKVIEYGSYQLPKTKEDVGLFLAYFRKFLDGALKRLQPHEVIFEAPILPGIGKTSIVTLRKLYGLAGLTELVVYDHSLICREANLSDIRVHVLGKGNIPKKRDAVKRAVQNWCVTMGWEPEDDNAADALALLDYALALRQPSRALKATPLFSDIGDPQADHGGPRMGGHS